MEYYLPQTELKLEEKPLVGSVPILVEIGAGTVSRYSSGANQTMNWRRAPMESVVSERRGINGASQLERIVAEQVAGLHRAIAARLTALLEADPYPQRYSK